MATTHAERTTMAVRVSTRDRIRRQAKAANRTVDAFLSQLIDEHEDRDFWRQMAETSPAEYERAAREDGVWPGDYDYSPEARLAK